MLPSSLIEALKASSSSRIGALEKTFGARAMGTQSGNLSQTSSSSPSISSAMHIESTAALGQSPLGPPTQTLPPSALGSGSGVESEPGSDNIQPPAVIGQKRKEPANKSPLWAHFTRCKLPNSDQIDTCWCTCNYCNEKVLCDTSYETINSIQGDLKKILLNMYDEYKGSEGSNQTEQSMAEYFGLDGDDLENLDEVSRQIARERMAEQSQCIRNEVDQYLSDRYVSLFTKNFEIHKWWKANEQTYLVLSKLAKDIFAIPCSTVASENAFSLGSRVVDPFRASLTPKMVEALVCTSDWLKSDPPNFYKDPTEDDLEMYHTLEELERDNAFNQGIDASSINSTTSVQTDV